MNKSFNQTCVLNFLFYWLVIVAPFVYYMRYTAYGFFHLEVAMMFGLLTMITLLVVLLEKLTGWVGRIILATLVVTVCFSFFPDVKTTNMFYITLFTMLILNLFLDNHIRTIFIIMSAVFILTTMVLSIPHQVVNFSEKHYALRQPINNALPPVIHLMLDENAGIEGIPDNIAQGKELRTELEKFYTSNGFHVYAGAYSHYVRTFNSVSNLVNFTSEPESHYYFNGNSNLTQNTYFKLMAEKGYRIRVYQFDSMINYCETHQYPIESCFDYPATNLNSILGLGIPSKDKFLFMLKSYLLWSQAYEMLIGTYQYEILPFFQKIGVNLPSWAWYQSRTSAVYIPLIFQKIARDVKQHSDGTLFYAHILGPHNPYVYDANCQLIKNPMKWQINISADPNPNTPATRAMRYALYENQVRCVTKQVQLLIDDLKQEGIYNKTIIIVNGDHGARITERVPLVDANKKLNLQSYHDCFDAFFAVKMPGVDPVTSFETVSLQQLLANVVSKITGTPVFVEATAPYVYLFKEEYHYKMKQLYLADVEK